MSVALVGRPVECLISHYVVFARQKYLQKTLLIIINRNLLLKAQLAVVVRIEKPHQSVSLSLTDSKIPVILYKVEYFV